MKKKLVSLLAVVMVTILLVPFALGEEAVTGKCPPDGDFEEELQVGTPGYVFQHGNEVGLSLSTEQVRSGSYSLLVTDREVGWGGPGWDVKEHLMENGWGDWYVSAYVRSVEPIAMQMNFIIYVKFDDGTEDWLTSNTNVTFGNDGWVRVNADENGNPVKLVSTTGETSNFSNLEVATLYMATGDDQLYDFYIDDVELYKDNPYEPPVEDTDDDENTGNPKTGYETNLLMVAIAIVSLGGLSIAARKRAASK